MRRHEKYLSVLWQSPLKLAERQGTERICHGHERAAVIESLVMDMDVKEEGMLNESRNDLHINCIIAANLKNKRSQWPSFLVNISSCPKMHQLTKFNDLRPNFAQIWNFASFTIYLKSSTQPLCILFLIPLIRSINKWNPGWRNDVPVNYCFNLEVSCCVIHK